MDPVQKIYEIVCKHLGKPDNRNNIRVSEEHEELLKDLQKHISAVCENTKKETEYNVKLNILKDIQKLF